MKKLWKIWALSLGQPIGDTESEVELVSIIRTIIVLINITCCFLIMYNILMR